jgi:glycosyltransferase involved in cell wall biosynthesis
MRICFVGKYPPIQGGVSMRTYWYAHGLAVRGHDVHVVTNAKEVEPQFRMFMRDVDWRRCGGAYGNGQVTVHWTDPVDASQSHIPMASPFVSKLATLAARVHSEQPLDVIYAHYMEPYGIAAHLAAEAVGVPYVVRMAGSDAGRLWHHPQLEMLYDHVLRSANVVILGREAAERARQRGVVPDHIATGGAFVVSEDMFTPEGPPLDLRGLRAEVAEDRVASDGLWGDFAGDRPYFGVYGKLGESKGSFELLAAIGELRKAGLDVGLVALAHGAPAVERAFRNTAEQLGLTDSVLQVPYLPHWRVPEFLRGCLAVCCLEQDFAIRFHAPIIPREVLLSGTCLVGSTEVIGKLPSHERIPGGYGCVAIDDVTDVARLAGYLAAIASNPERAATVGQRGRAFARELQRGTSFPQTLERILETAARRQQVPSSLRWAARAETPKDPFRFVRLAAAAIGGFAWPPPPAASEQELTQARDVHSRLEEAICNGRRELRPLLYAVEIEIAIAEAEIEADQASPMDNLESSGFRLQIREWALADADVADLLPLRERSLRIVRFDFDISVLQGAQLPEELPAGFAEARSYLAVFGATADPRRVPLRIDELAAKILELSDGASTAREILQQLGSYGTDTKHLRWIEGLFVQGLIRLSELPRKHLPHGTMDACTTDVCPSVAACGPRDNCSMRGRRWTQSR